MQRWLVLICLLSPFLINAQQILKPGQKVEKKISKDEKHTYTIGLKTGECVSLIILQKKVDLVIDAIDPSGQKIKSFDSPTGDEGNELIFIQAEKTGQYVISVYPFIEVWAEADITAWKGRNPGKSFDSLMISEKEQNQGNYQIDSLIILSQLGCEKKLAEEKIALAKKIEEKKLLGEKITAWISENAHILKSVTAGSGFEDLQWLKKVLKDVKYVGLGEATHGTREFFQMKHRMLEFLVKQMGFTAFAMEGSYQGWENINNYILHGTGDAHTALTSQGFWSGNTEENIDMIEWLYKYNLTVPDRKKVRFFGVDIQIFAKSGAIDSIGNYLATVDSTLAKKVAPLLRLFYKIDFEKTLNTKIPILINNNPVSTSIDSLRKEFANLLVDFSMRQGEYLSKSNPIDYSKNLYRITNILQMLDAYGVMTINVAVARRDFYMASNFKNFVVANPETKIVLWAHNGHISRAKSFKFIGSYLNEAYGSAYFPIAFAFNQGSFQALEMEGVTNKGLQEFTVPPAKEQTLDWLLAQTKKGEFIVNFKEKRLPDYVSKFLEGPVSSRSFGSTAYRINYTNIYNWLYLKNDFDALIFIDKTTRARPTSTGMR